MNEDLMSTDYHNFILYKRMVEVAAAALQPTHPELAGELNVVCDGMERLLNVIPRQ